MRMCVHFCRTCFAKLLIGVLLSSSTRSSTCACCRDEYIVWVGRSALKEQAATDLREMLKLDGTSISEATLTVRSRRSLCQSMVNVQIDSLLHGVASDDLRLPPYVSTCLLRQALNVKGSTTTPLWKGLWVMLKYRTRNNYVRHAPVHLACGASFEELHAVAFESCSLRNSAARVLASACAVTGEGMLHTPHAVGAERAPRHADGPLRVAAAAGPTSLGGCLTRRASRS